MRKFGVAAFLVLGLMAYAGVAGADPIKPNVCGIDDATGAGLCDIYADYTGATGSALGIAEGNFGNYLLGYTFLLNQNADLSDGFQMGDVAHILVIHDSLFELFSNTVFDTLFAPVFAAASTGAPIDGVSPSIGQLAGCPPVPSGVPSLDGVGYCTNADLVTVYANWGVGGEGGQDIVNIHTAFAEGEGGGGGPAPVPEPGTLSLLALGGSAAFAKLRRQRRLGKTP